MSDGVETLLPVVRRAAANVLRSRSHYRRERDDLLGEGGLVLAKALQRPAVDDLPKYVFRSARRAMVKYLESLPIIPPGYRPRERLGERELLCRHHETLEDIRSACRDAVDHEIVTRRDNGDTLAEIAVDLGMDKSTVSRKLSAIFVRLSATL